MSVYLTPAEAAAIAHALEVLEELEERTRSESIHRRELPVHGAIGEVDLAGIIRLSEVSGTAKDIVFQVANIASAYLGCDNAEEILATRNRRATADVKPPYRFRDSDENAVGAVV